MQITRKDLRRYRGISVVICLVGVILVFSGIKSVGFPVIAIGLFFLFAPHKVSDGSTASSNRNKFSMEKELYINQLVAAFRITHNCGDMAAIECLRRNYSLDELKDITNDLKEAEAHGDLDRILRYDSPFRDDPEEIKHYDNLHGGN